MIILNFEFSPITVTAVSSRGQESHVNKAVYTQAPSLHNGGVEVSESRETNNAQQSGEKKKHTIITHYTTIPKKLSLTIRKTKVRYHYMRNLTRTLRNITKSYLNNKKKRYSREPRDPDFWTLILNQPNDSSEKKKRYFTTNVALNELT